MPFSLEECVVCVNYWKREMERVVTVSCGETAAQAVCLLYLHLI